MLDTIPGVDTRAAEMLLAKIGPDLSRLPDRRAPRLLGRPGQRESGAKKHSAATGKGSKWLRGTLTECTKGIVRTEGTYLSARYHRIKRHGHAKATIATGHKILTAAYHVLNQAVPYHELGEQFFYRRDRACDSVAGIERFMDALVFLQEQRDAHGGCPIGSLASQLAERDEGARLALGDGFKRWEAEIRSGLEAMAAHAPSCASAAIQGCSPPRRLPRWRAA